MSTAERLADYVNGDYYVEIFKDGTKIRTSDDTEPKEVEFPESVDLKITQYCDMDHICVYCHEMSDKNGKHADLKKIYRLWQESQEPGTEVAIGGGNPLAHPHLEEFLLGMTDSGFLCNLTVNIMHVKKYKDLLIRFQEDETVRGLGISYRSNFNIDKLPLELDYSNVVFHMILGVHTLNDCVDIINWCVFNDIEPKILLLGYKLYGNGASFYSTDLEHKLELWKTKYIKRLLDFDNIVLAFDNLAIDQLDLRNQFSEEEWSQMYQGDDGSHTCYIDAVKMEVARSSTSEERFSIQEGDTMQKLFKKVCYQSTQPGFEESL